jgi:hypothetical protein
MSDRDDTDTDDLVKQVFRPPAYLVKGGSRVLQGLPPTKSNKPLDADGDACRAFGYRRGLTDMALTVQFRLRSGDSETYAYGCLVSVRFNPSVGLLLKFSADVTTLALIRGSNLDMPVNGVVNLTDSGFPRHRIDWVREMDQDELQKAGEGEPTIDGIDIADFQTAEEQREWLRRWAPAFLRPSG